MDKSDIKFLKDLQQELRTQETDCQANPRFWVVMQSVKDYYNNENEDGFSIINNDSDELFCGEWKESAEWIRDELDCDDVVIFDDKSKNIILETEGIELENIFDLKIWFENHGRQYIICPFSYKEEIVENTMFLTKRECIDHISNNHYHYFRAHPHAMTAWRSPQVERLLKILETTDFDKFQED